MNTATSSRLDNSEFQAAYGALSNAVLQLQQQAKAYWLNEFRALGLVPEQDYNQLLQQHHALRKSHRQSQRQLKTFERQLEAQQRQIDALLTRERTEQNR